MKDVTEDKKLDFDAPLLSVRRLSAEAAAAASSSSASPPGRANGGSDRRPPEPAPAPRRFSLPFYKSELKSGPVRHPGVVPFVWEKTPGQPKNGVGRRPPATPKPPPGWISNNKNPHSSPDPAAPAAKLGSKSVRTQKAAAFLPNGNPAADTTSSETINKDDVKYVEEEKVGTRPQQQQPPTPAWDGQHDDDVDDDVFTDAPDTLSRTESFFMNCSVSGLSSFPDPPKPSGCSSTESQPQDFMMARFLPAAQALASDSPQYTFRKPATPAREPTRATDRIVSENLRRSPLIHHPCSPSHVSHFAGEQVDDDGGEGDGDEEDYDDAAHVPSRACGLLPKFSLKGSFCLLNPFPGIKHRGHPPPSRRRGIHSPQIKTSHRNSLDEHWWEAVYKHKQGQGHQPQVEDAHSRLTSESNHHAYWSDSTTADGSSPYQRSNGGALSPYRYEVPPSPFHEGKGFLGVPSRESKSSKTGGSGVHEEDGNNHWEMTWNHKRLGEMDDYGNQKNDVIHNGPQHSEAGDLLRNSVSRLQSPLLLPQSPSESWLFHTLPSVTSKYPKPQSFLGLRFQPRKQALQASSIDPKRESKC